MTYEEAAAVQNLTHQECQQLWNTFMALVTPQRDDCTVSPWQRKMIEALIATAPRQFRRCLNSGHIELIGLFPWTDNSGFKNLVSISIVDHINEACMCDQELSDWSFLESTEVTQIA